MSSESLAQAVARNSNWINTVISNSKLSSQLSELVSITSLDQKIVVQEGVLDAKYANVKSIRGYKGLWNATTNIPTLSNSSGVVGDVYKVSVAGNINIGSGSIYYVVGDLIYLSEDNWIKISPNQISDITGLQLALDSLAGGLIPQGNWNALSNVPDIGTGATTGQFWIVSVAGSTNVGGITDWEVNDWAVRTATGWAKIDNTDKVLSVAGRTGVIVLGITDITGLTAELANTVKLTGNQSIAGQKTFTELVTMTDRLKLSDSRGNTLIGDGVGTSITTGAFNVGVGLNVLQDNTIGTYNVGLGDLALHQNTEGSNNFAGGSFSMWTNSTGSFNVAIGHEASRINTTGSFNVAIGSEASKTNTTGENNIGIGKESLWNNRTGSHNIGVGLQAGKYIANGVGNNRIPQKSIFIGQDTRANADGQTNQIVIGDTAIGNGSNTVTLGNNSIATTYLKGDVNITGSITGGGGDFLPLAGGTLTGALTGTSAAFTGTTTVQGTGDSSFVGNVGIGTNSPNAKLHVGPSTLVSGYTPTTTTLAVSDVVNGAELLLRGKSPRIWFDSTAAGNAEIYLDGTKLNILSDSPSAPGESRLYIKADGNVGIGTTTPTDLLALHNNATGAVDAQMNFTTAATGQADGNGFRVGWNGNVAQMYLFENADMRIGTNNVERIRILADGNVGIGETNPLATLDVHNKNGGDAGSKSQMQSNAVLKLRPHATNSTNMLFSQLNSGSAMGITVTNSAATADWDIALNPFGGNVAIGTDNPSVKLQVKGTTIAGVEEIGFLEAGNGTVGSGAALGFANSGFLGSYPNWRLAQISAIYETSNTFDGALIFKTSNAANEGVERMRISSAGDVGIDATSNSAEDTNNGVPKFQVNTTTAALGEFPLAARFTTNSDAGDNSGVSVLINSGNDRGLMISAGRKVGNVALAKLNIVENTGAELTGITMLQNGPAGTAVNVGIGTNNPDTKLKIENNLAGMPSATYATTVANSTLHLSAETVPFYNHLLMGVGSAESSWIQSQHGNSNAKDLLLNPIGGNVGIGTTAPGAKLDVDGVIRAGSGGSTGGSLGFEIDYSGANVINTWSTEYSSSDSVFGVAVRAKNGVANAFTSTAGNAAFQKGALVLGDDLEFLNAPGTIVAIGSDVAMTSRFKIKSSGEVGIGTDSPDALLHVRAATDVTGTIEVQGGKAVVTSAGEINSELNFGSNDASATGGIGGSIKSVTENTNGAYVGMSFYTAKQGRTPVLEEAMRIDHNGNVGIGTDNPNEMLEVDGNIRLGDGADRDIIGPTNSSLRILANPNSSTEGIIFSTDLGTTTEMFIQDGGKVGIGTDSPLTLLNLEGVKNTSIITLESTTNDASWSVGDKIGAINFYSADDSGAGAGVKASMSYEVSSGGTGATNALVFNTAGTTTGTNNTERMRINSTGTVTIGDISTTNTGKFGYTPGVGTYSGIMEMFHSTTNALGSGFVNFYRDSSVIGSINQVGTNGISYNTSSDYRLKEDLQDFGGLDMVSKIPVYNYKWKSDESRSYGVMAHELQEVLPNAVSGEKDAEEMQGVDYSKIVPLLIKSIQELKAEIEILKAK